MAQVMPNNSRWTKGRIDSFLIWDQGSDTVKVRINDADIYYLRARKRRRPLSGRATMVSHAVEIYVRFPNFAASKYSINGAIIFLRQLGIDDVDLFIEMCQGQGWAVT
jgi:hypothetical protein